MPLFGVPFAVKDNIDVAGLPTTAGCPAFAYTPERTAPAVARLQKAGALLVGKTNLDQFATGLAGDRSPYGACRNVFNQDYISGGSSSGSALAVAAGLVSFALGTDTAGSGRVPAGCNNIVGLKPTPGVLSTEGVVPASRSFDCVSIFALTADDAQRVCDVAAGEPCSENPVPSVLDEERFAFAVPRAEDLEFYGDTEQARLFGQSVAALERLGGWPRPIDFRPLREVADLLYDGPWLAERLAGLEDFLKAHAADVFPVTREILMRGARFSGVDVFRAQARLATLRARCAEVFQDAEILVVPTMPALPTLAEVQADSVGWSRRLGHYTNFVNLLGWAALAVPAGFTRAACPPASLSAVLAAATAVCALWAWRGNACFTCPWAEPANTCRRHPRAPRMPVPPRRPRPGGSAWPSPGRTCAASRGTRACASWGRASCAPAVRRDDTALSAFWT